jgi:hypothetical protein
VSRRKGTRHWFTFIGYLLMAIGTFCLFFRYAFPGGSDRAEWALTAWGLLVFGVGSFIAGGILILATEGWARMVGRDASDLTPRGNLPR